MLHARYSGNESCTMHLLDRLEHGSAASPS